MVEVELEDFSHHAAPVEGKVLSWTNLTYSVSSPKPIFCLPEVNVRDTHINQAKKKMILNGMTGVLPPGKFMAIIGSSGAGKTTFLNALANQFDSNGTLGGEILIGDIPLTKKTFAVYCGYVHQEDILMPNCTVQETLDFYAFMRLPHSMSRKDKKQRIQTTMRKLGLTGCAKTICGGKSKKGISGGEKRRVSIAIELIRNPTILFLDEPTSGLDSKTSLSVIQTLVHLAHAYNHSIVCTIHQPRSQIFNAFDYLMILSKGNQIFFGPCSQALPYFNEKLGYPCPIHENPADFFIDLLTIDPSTEKTTKDSQERVARLIEQAKETPFVDQSKDTETAQHDDEFLNENNEGGAWWPMQFFLITRRSIQNTFRDKPFLIGRTIQTIILAVLIIILWSDMDDDQLSIQDRISVIFMILLGATFSEAVAATLVFPTERGVYQRERQSRMYQVSSYYVSKQVTEFPLQFGMPVILCAITYYAVGLKSDFDVFVLFTILIVLLCFAVNSAGFCLGAAMPGGIAALLVPSALLILMLFAGFYLNPNNFPTWISWVKYLSPFYYAFCAAIVLQLEDYEFYCKDDQFVTYDATLTCPDGEIITASASRCPTTNGNTIVDNFSADDMPLWVSYVVLAGMALFFRLFMYIPLLKAKPKEIQLN